MPTVSMQDAQRLCTAILVAAGAEAGEAAETSLHLVEASLRGHDSHGIFRVVEYARALQKGELVSPAPLRLLVETDALVVGDGGYGLGQVLGNRLTDLLAPRASAVGVASGAVRHCGHVGRLGDFVERAARHGLAAMLLVNDNGTEALVAPAGGTRGFTSTNPMAFAAPTDGEPVVLDMSTSTVAAGKVRARQREGEACEPGWLLDASGEPTVDPSALYRAPRGSLLPLGGKDSFKGFGLALFVDLLAAGLSGGACPPMLPEARDANNIMMTLWNPRLFAGSEHFSSEAGRMLAAVRANPPARGHERVLAPGDHSRELRAQRAAGGIPVSDESWPAITELAAELAVELAAGHA